jgi:hypothetical protein
MAFDDLKDRFSETGSRILSSIQESSAFLELQEKYQGLSSTGQKLTLIGATLVGLLLVLAVPLMFYFSANDQITQYEDKQQLIRDLFRISHETASIQPPPPAVSSTELESRARSALANVRLQPEQINAVTALPSVSVPGISKAVEQSGVSVNLKKLNLKQLIDAGHELQLVHPTAKMMGIDVVANQPDPHYFDVTYKIVAFSAKPDTGLGSKNGKRSR